MSLLLGSLGLTQVMTSLVGESISTVKSSKSSLNPRNTFSFFYSFHMTREKMLPFFPWNYTDDILLQKGSKAPKSIFLVCMLWWQVSPAPFCEWGQVWTRPASFAWVKHYLMFFGLLLHNTITRINWKQPHLTLLWVCPENEGVRYGGGELVSCQQLSTWEGNMVNSNHFHLSAPTSNFHLLSSLWNEEFVLGEEPLVFFWWEICFQFPVCKRKGEPCWQHSWWIAGSWFCRLLALLRNCHPEMLGSHKNLRPLVVSVARFLNLWDAWCVAYLCSCHRERV